MRGHKLADSKTKMVEFVSAISRIGPHINSVCTGIGVHKETGRYWYRKKLLSKGFAVQAAVAYERLGLKYFVMVVDFGDDFEDYAKPLLWAMSELCYLRYYNKTLLGGEYIVHAIVPEEHVEAYQSFLRKLQEKGIFRSISFFVADWHRNIPMRAEFFDFDHGVWDFDWGKLTPKYDERDEIRPHAKEDFDRIDLEILKQLQLDANTTITKIAAKAESSMKNTQYHYSKHVMGRGLIRNYRVNWLGSRYDYNLEKAMHRRHQQMFLNLIVTNLTDPERIEVRAGMNQFPSLWAEAAGHAFYYAEVAIPSEAATEGYAALSKALRRVRKKYVLYVGDHTNGIGFTLNPRLYDPLKGAWNFKPDELLPKFEELAMKIRQGG